MKKVFAGIIGVLALLLPLAAQAYPFGGMIGQIIFCYNNAIYTAVGPPRGGPFIWTPSTRTYQFGPPTHSGQWLLGLAAPPYYCLVSIQPIIVWSGVLMTMEGSSGPAAPGRPGGGLGNSSGGTGAGSGSAGINHVIVSELYPQVDAAHGNSVQYQWIELYNPTSADINISRWTIRSTSTSQTIPDNTILGARQRYVFAGTSAVRSIWSIDSGIQVAVFPNAFQGFVASGDHVFLLNSAGAQIDAVSYGTDTSAFSPSAPAVTIGHALARRNVTTDSNTANDWIDTTAPSPGR